MNSNLPVIRAGQLLDTVGRRSSLPMVGFLLGSFYSLLLWGWLAAVGWLLLSFR